MTTTEITYETFTTGTEFYAVASQGDAFCNSPRFPAAWQAHKWAADRNVKPANAQVAARAAKYGY